jgi:hypothetical protein
VFRSKSPCNAMSQPLVDFTNVDTPTSKRTKLDDPDVSGASQASAEVRNDEQLGPQFTLQ